MFRQTARAKEVAQKEHVHCIRLTIIGVEPKTKTNYLWLKAESRKKMMNEDQMQALGEKVVEVIKRTTALWLILNRKKI